QVQHDLLQLHLIARHKWDVIVQLQLQGDLPGVQFAPGDGEYFLHDNIDIQLCPLERSFTGERTDALDDLTCPIRIGDYTIERFLRPDQILHFEPASTGIAPRDDSSQRLVDLVRNGRGQLAHCCYPRDAC